MRQQWAPGTSLEADRRVDRASDPVSQPSAVSAAECQSLSKHVKGSSSSSSIHQETHHSRKPTGSNDIACANLFPYGEAYSGFDYAADEVESSVSHVDEIRSDVRRSRPAPSPQGVPGWPYRSDQAAGHILYGIHTAMGRYSSQRPGGAAMNHSPQQRMHMYQEQGSDPLWKKGEALRDAQLQHAVVLDGKVPLDDSLAAIAARYYCEVCGVATTSETNLQDHIRGRKHQRRASRAAEAAGQSPLELNGLDMRRRSVSASALERMVSRAQLPGLGDRLSSNASFSSQMNRGEAAAMAGNLQRMPSGNVYEGFPCIRIGDFVLPSSMDFRQYLDEMQQIGELPQNPAHRVGALLRAASLAASQAAAAADLVASGMTHDDISTEQRTPSVQGSEYAPHAFSCRSVSQGPTSPRHGYTPRPPLCGVAAQSPSGAIQLSDSLSEALSSRNASFIATPGVKAAVAAATAAVGGGDLRTAATAAVRGRGSDASALDASRSAMPSSDHFQPQTSALVIISSTEILNLPTTGPMPDDAGGAVEHAASEGSLVSGASDEARSTAASVVGVIANGVVEGSTIPETSALTEREAQNAAAFTSSSSDDADETDVLSVSDFDSQPEPLTSLPIRRQLSYAAAVSRAIALQHTQQPPHEVSTDEDSACDDDSVVLSRPEQDVHLTCASRDSHAGPTTDHGSQPSGSSSRSPTTAEGMAHAMPVSPGMLIAQTEALHNGSIKGTETVTASDTSEPTQQPCDGDDTARATLPSEEAAQSDEAVAMLHPGDIGNLFIGVGETEGLHNHPLQRNSASGTVSPLDALSDGYHSAGDDGQVFCCQMCDVTTSSLSHLEAHFQGKRHQRRLGNGGRNSDGGSCSGSRNLQSCPLCCVTTTSAEHMELHLAGKAHQRKLRILAVQRRKGKMGDNSVRGAGSEDGNDVDSIGSLSASGPTVGAGLVYVCRRCSITTTSPENLQAHFDGALHKKKLRQAQAFESNGGRCPVPQQRHNRMLQGGSYHAPGRYHVPQASRYQSLPEYHHHHHHYTPDVYDAEASLQQLPQHGSHSGPMMHQLRRGSHIVTSDVRTAGLPVSQQWHPHTLRPHLQSQGSGDIYLHPAPYSPGGGVPIVAHPVPHPHPPAIHVMGPPLTKQPSFDSTRLGVHQPHHHGFTSQLQRAHSGSWHQQLVSPLPQTIHYPQQGAGPSVIFGHPGQVAVFAGPPTQSPMLPQQQWAYLGPPPAPQVVPHFGGRPHGETFHPIMGPPPISYSNRPYSY